MIKPMKNKKQVQRRINELIEMLKEMSGKIPKYDKSDIYPRLKELKWVMED